MMEHNSKFISFSMPFKSKMTIYKETAESNEFKRIAYEIDTVICKIPSISSK